VSAAVTGGRQAVVSCHVERPLDDRVWRAFSEVQERTPGGFRVAALIRPPDGRAGEDEDAWVERARVAAARGPLGQHTHWTAPDHARPTDGCTGERVLEEGRRLHELGIAPTLFCGGGWYTDAQVAEACAELGYVDCTPRARRPPYLAGDARWAHLAQPGWVELPSGSTLPAVPTTHSLGDLARSLPGRSLAPVVHVYFHDTDLLDRRRRALVSVLLPLLARRAEPSDLDTLARSLPGDGPRVAWNDVARPIP
jgi:hypothetical protein